MTAHPHQLEFSLDAINVRNRLHEAEHLVNELAAYLRSARGDPRSPHQRDRGNALYQRSLRFLGRAG